MELTEVSVRVRRADAARVEALLNLADPLALSFDDAADAPLFEPSPGEMPLWPELVIRALFASDFDTASLRNVLVAAIPDLSAIELREINDEDWRAGLEQSVYVRHIADNLCIVPAHRDQAAVPAENAVQLHMGLAFGTGRHPTTALCLEWLAAHPPHDLTVCDFGCGSGVLALAALRLGAKRAIAIDSDPQAIAATRANAKLNGVENRLETGKPEQFAGNTFDVVLANILAGTLIESAELIASLLNPAGQIVLSGVLENQVQSVERAFADRFEAFEVAVSDGWARIAAIMSPC